MVSDLARQPYLWSGIAALALGLGIGQALRWLAGGRGGSKARARSRRAARAMSFAGLALLAAAAFLVAAPSMLRAPPPEFLLWCGAVLAAGIAWGFYPLAAGIPLAAAVLAFVLLARTALAGWVPFGGPSKIAQLLPFGVDRGSGLSGELELVARGSEVPVSKVELPFAQASLAVESLELRGPLSLVAAIVKPGGARRFYRVLGIVGPGMPDLSPTAGGGAPGRTIGGPGILERLAALPEGGGLVPGALPAVAQGLGGLLERRRAASPSAPLLPLEPLVFWLGPDMEIGVHGSP